MSDTREGINNSHSEEMNAPRAGAWSLTGKQPEMLALLTVIYVHTRATQCRNKIGAHTEMNLGPLTDRSCPLSTTF